MIRRKIKQTEHISLPIQDACPESIGRSLVGDVSVGRATALYPNPMAGPKTDAFASTLMKI